MADDEPFGNEGVIKGAGKAGENQEKWVNDIMNDPDRAQVVMYYGVSALVLASLNLLLYLILQNRSWIINPASKWWFWVHELVWWPVGIIWIAMAFFDAKWLRDIFSGIVTMSFLGPWAGYWAAIVWLMVQTDKYRWVTKKGKSKTGWGKWYFWLVFPIYMGYTVFSMIIQVGMIPKIYDWIDNAPINENYPKEKPAQNAGQPTGDDAEQPTDDFIAQGVFSF